MYSEGDTASLETKAPKYTPLSTLNGTAIRAEVRHDGSVLDIISPVMMDVSVKNLQCNFEPFLIAIANMVDSEGSSVEIQTRGREKLQQYINDAVDLLNAYQGPLEQENQGARGRPQAQSVSEQRPGLPTSGDVIHAQGPQGDDSMDNAQWEKVRFSKELKKAIKEYCEGKKEILCYEPLCNALNTILSYFRESRPNLNAIYKISDPAIIQSEYAIYKTKRKPDVFATNWMSFRSLLGSTNVHASWEEIREAKLPKSRKERKDGSAALGWNDIFQVIEVKMNKISVEHKNRLSDAYANKLLDDHDNLEHLGLPVVLSEPGHTMFKIYTSQISSLHAGQPGQAPPSPMTSTSGTSQSNDQHRLIINLNDDDGDPTSYPVSHRNHPPDPLSISRELDKLHTSDIPTEGADSRVVSTSTPGSQNAKETGGRSGSLNPHFLRRQAHSNSNPGPGPSASISGSNSPLMSGAHSPVVYPTSSPATSGANSGASTPVGSGTNTPGGSNKRKRENDKTSADSGNKKLRVIDKSTARSYAQVQLSVYAAERLSSAPWILSVPGLILKGSVLYLWWYDRQGVICSSGIDFIDHLPHFIVMVRLLQELHETPWGSGLPDFEVDPRKNICRIEIEDKMYEFDLKAIKKKFVLFGRATATVDVTEVGFPNNKLFLKMTAADKSRPSEAEVLQTIWDRAAREKPAKLPWLRERLPRLVASKRFTGFSTSRIRQLLGLSGGEGRILDCSIFEKLEPITKLQGMELWKAYWDTIQCHYELWELGIHHNDISVGNLMHRNKAGVLNDFDLAFIVPKTANEERSRGQCEKTGTLPFMSLDLLTHDTWLGHVERLYRHDLESFMWVFLWICACYNDGEPVDVPIVYQGWTKGDPQLCHDLKAGSLLGIPFVQPSHSHRGLGLAASILADFWNDFYQDRRKKLRNIRRGQSGSGEPMALSHELSASAVLDKLVEHVRASYEHDSDILSALPTSNLAQ